MSRIGDKARLRNTLRKLDAARASHVAPADRAEAAQEALDMLAMLAGLKPVYLLGRGLAEPAWIRDVLQVAVDRRLYVVEGPYWDAAPEDAVLPGWFRDHARAAFGGLRAHYICRARAVADEVEAVCGGGHIDIAREARLLGYPECCVAAHHRRALAYQELWLGMLSRACGGDEAEMRRRLADGDAIEPATADERARLEAAMAVRPAPFTSINMCDACADGTDTPARRLSARYRELARAADPGLERELAIAAAAMRS